LTLCGFCGLCAFALAFFKSVVWSSGHMVSIVGMGPLSGFGLRSVVSQTRQGQMPKTVLCYPN
jgi:hypothetical protein